MDKIEFDRLIYKKLKEIQVYCDKRTKSDLDRAIDLLNDLIRLINWEKISIK